MVFEWQEGKTRDEKINGGVLGFPFFFVLGSRVVINDKSGSTARLARSEGRGSICTC